MSQPEAVVELLLFEVAGLRYGADLTQVRHIDNRGGADSFGHPLGAPAHQRRALVVQVDGVERRLAVDVVLGVRAVPVSELRRMPPAAAAPAASLGAWLDGEDPVLLVDLCAFASPHPEPVHGQ